MGGEVRQRLYDEFLRDVVAELLTHDERVRGLDVSADVDGGVVHLVGAVARAGQLTLLRSLLGRIGGVHAVWDRVRVGGRDPVIVDLGCGDQRQYPTNVGVDRRRTPDVAAVADVSRPLPFRDGGVDRIF